MLASKSMEKQLTSGELLNAIETIVQRNVTSIVKGIVKAEIQESQIEILGTIHEFATHVDRRFNEVDQRFDAVDQRFKQVDEQFKQVDERFDAVDQRFKQVDQRFDALDRLLLSDGFPIVRSTTPLPRRRRR